MTDSSTLTETRSKLRSLAKELLDLSETFDFHAEDIWTPEKPITRIAKAFIRETQSPIDYAAGIMSQGMEGCVVHALQYLDVFNHIPTNGSITLDDLALKTSTQPALLDRLLRIPVGSGLILQLQSDDGRYSHSRISRGFVGDDALPASLLDISYTAALSHMSRLPEYFAERRQSTITPDFPLGQVREPNDPKFNPLTWGNGRDGTDTYQILNERPAQLRRFQRALGAVAHLNPIVGYYDYDRLAVPNDPSRVVLVDIGGGTGQTLDTILAAHPSIRPDQCVLQDVPLIIEKTPIYNPALTPGIRLQAHDYTTRQPVQGARAYLIRAVAHNLSDENLVAILAQIVPAMARDSKLLIAESVVPPTGVKALSGLMDLMMMAMGGKERTELNFREVLDRAGLVVDAVHQAPGNRIYAVVEASLK